MRTLDMIRAQARTFEQALPTEQRKRLGQFFTGIRLGKVLAHLALERSTRTVLDPFAGHGDLLDATWEAAMDCGISLSRLDAVEIDKRTADTCHVRLSRLKDAETEPKHLVIKGDAFEPHTVQRLPVKAYDLVITNPPYVRYQARNPLGLHDDKTRTNLKQVINRHLPFSTGTFIWNRIIENYSGHADLSIPAWILSGALVRPGGHLAMVVPATWRSRDYADVARFLLVRCFEVKVIVEDKQPGWFCDAQIRTNLIVAQRLEENAITHSFGSQGRRSTAPRLEIAPEAASPKSLVGAAFEDDKPEASFASWTLSNKEESKIGIVKSIFDVTKEWAAIRHLSRRKAWFRTLKGDLSIGTLSHSQANDLKDALPYPIQTIIPDGLLHCGFQMLSEAGIRTGQGLRTGCNAFFYVTVQGTAADGSVIVETSALFGKRKFSFPKSVLQSVIRRQADVSTPESFHAIPGRVLDLREWMLPEDAQTCNDKASRMSIFGKILRIMPNQLAAYVRLAATTSAKKNIDGPLIPELSAVRTNIRSAKGDYSRQRYWYMLPDFAPRHRPTAFVPRINHDTPWVEANTDNPVLVDANFSTFWSPDASWSRYAIKALLNSSWSHAYMEAVGTPMGGGALKLEATHLRHMLFPKLSYAARAKLDVVGRSLCRDSQEKMKAIDDIVLSPFVSSNSNVREQVTQSLANELRQFARQLSTSRRRSL